jgi:hypothetical protein
VLRHLGQTAGLSLPPGARVIGASTWKFQCALTRLKFEFSPRDLDNFVQQPPFQGVKWDEKSRGLMPPSDDEFPWMNNENSRRFKSGEVKFPAVKGHLHVLIDLDDANKVVVYLMLFSD